jgi:hypothetical protein
MVYSLAGLEETACDGILGYLPCVDSYAWQGRPASREKVDPPILDDVDCIVDTLSDGVWKAEEGCLIVCRWQLDGLAGLALLHCVMEMSRWR